MNDSSPPRALIVDDEPTVRQAVMRALNQSGFTCDAAADGRAAIEMVNRSCFDVVITDLRMPELNGHKLAAELLDLPGRPAIVVLTGVLEPRLSDDLWARGVDDIQYKPVDFGLLAMKIRRIVEQRRQATPASQRNVESEAAHEPETDKATCIARGVSDPDGVVAADHVAPGCTIAVEVDSHKPSTEQDSDAVVALDLAKPRHKPESATKVHTGASDAHDLVNAFEKLQHSLSAKQQQAAFRYVVLFAAGILAGWLLSWLGPAAMLWR